MRILCLDVETTSPNRYYADVCELGLVLFESESQRTIHWMDLVLQTSPPKSDDAEKIHGLTYEFTSRFGMSQARGLNALTKVFIPVADAICYYAISNFDRHVIEMACVRNGFAVPQIPWIDAEKGLSKSYGSLADTASANDIVNPFPHCALGDAYVLSELLRGENVDELLKKAVPSDVVLVADVSRDQKDLAKERGFRWTGKEWIKLVQPDEVDSEISRATFPVRRQS